MQERLILDGKSVENPTVRNGNTNSYSYFYPDGLTDEVPTITVDDSD